MTRESINGDYDPYSWWHRNLPSQKDELRQRLKMMDLDVVGDNQTTLQPFIEYNSKRNGKIVDPVVIIETINRNGESGGKPLDDALELKSDKPLNRHKKLVLTTLSKLTELPVFVVWVDWVVVNRKEDHRVDYAKPGRFYVKQLPNGEESVLNMDGYIDFLHQFHKRGNLRKGVG